MSPGRNPAARNVSNVDPHSLGGQLRRLREEAGLTQTELGNAVGLPQARISEYERNTHKPNEDLIIEIAKVLNVSPGRLYEATRWGTTLPVGTERREKLRHLDETDWRLFDHVLDVVGEITPAERARFERTFEKFLSEWKDFETV